MSLSAYSKYPELLDLEVDDYLEALLGWDKNSFDGFGLTRTYIEGGLVMGVICIPDSSQTPAIRGNSMWEFLLRRLERLLAFLGQPYFREFFNLFYHRDGTRWK